MVTVDVAACSLFTFIVVILFVIRNIHIIKINVQVSNPENNKHQVIYETV